MQLKYLMDQNVRKELIRQHPQVWRQHFVDDCTTYFLRPLLHTLQKDHFEKLAMVFLLIEQETTLENYLTTQMSQWLDNLAATRGLLKRGREYTLTPEHKHAIIREALHGDGGELISAINKALVS
jgi:hypothetical protein